MGRQAFNPAIPLVAELCPPPDPEQAFLALSRLPGCLFLDSARRHETLGRYSFIAADPFAWIERPADSKGTFEILAEELSHYVSAGVPGLPPFQGGAAGLFSYDLGRQLERLPAPGRDEFQVPGLAVGLYDVVLAIDHQEDRAWIISHGWPDRDINRRQERAQVRLNQFRRWLAGAIDGPRPESRPGSLTAGELSSGALTSGELAPQYRVAGSVGLTSNFSRDAYLRTIERAIEYIHAGDVFQVNLSQRLLHRADDDSIALYLRLRRRNPATFAGYFDLGDVQIVSASPERFLSVQGRHVEARPIKGTRQRVALPETDMFVGAELRECEKDRAENVMIVDLLRNDLSRVCRPDSVRVTQLCQLETFEFVQHLVSAVEGTLDGDYSGLDLVRSAFPGGSVTGAPKVRAMEIIAELEPTARGAYCGALGYVGFDGSLDTSILIRTFTAARGWWQAPVGGGIVAQSVPEQEYEETWHKAEGLIRALC